jgi:hypothetical protein
MEHVERAPSAPTYGQEGKPTTPEEPEMQIRTRMSMSADGYVTTPEGLPSLIADPAFVSGQSHGFHEFVDTCEAALMGRTTFEPALSPDTGLTLEGERALPGGSVELTYAVKENTR